MSDATDVNKLTIGFEIVRDKIAEQAKAVDNLSILVRDIHNNVNLLTMEQKQIKEGLDFISNTVWKDKDSLATRVTLVENYVLRIQEDVKHLNIEVKKEFDALGQESLVHKSLVPGWIQAWGSIIAIVVAIIALVYRP
jgi:hypothetical protein